MLQRFLALLLALFSLPVVEGDADGDAGGGNDGDAGGGNDGDAGGEDTQQAAGEGEGAAADDEDDDTLEALLDRQGTEVPAGADKAGGKKQTPSEREEAKLLRESIESSRETRRLLESRLPPQQQPQVDPQEQADLRAIEEARASNDENRIRGAEWAYNTNRINRENQRKADMAVFLAQESEDKQSFREMGREDPKMFKRYKDKVETKLAELRTRGQSLPRITLYDWMVGKDIREARANGGIKTRKTSAGADGVQRADRGRTPGARSDVSGRGNGRLSKKAELEKRLTNVRI